MSFTVGEMSFAFGEMSFAFGEMSFGDFGWNEFPSKRTKKSLLMMKIDINLLIISRVNKKPFKKLEPQIT